MSEFRKILITGIGKADTYNDTNIEVDKDEILLKVHYCGICRTDGKLLAEGHRDLLLPCVPGHEFCGSDTNGNLYAVWPAASCGTCSFCTAGKENLCPDIEIAGFSRPGAMADYVAVPQKSLFAAPEQCQTCHLIFAEPLACAVNAVEKIRTNSESSPDSVLILGGGVCGLLCAAAADYFGIRPVIIENSPVKRKKIKQFTEENNFALYDSVPEKESFGSLINACTDADAFFKTLKKIHPASTAVFFSGFSNSAPSVSPDILNSIHYRELSVTGAYGCSKSHFSTALEIISEAGLNFDAITENIICLEQAVDKITKAYSGKYLRFIIDMNK
jgi:nicotinate-nucleotide--dimethylbenzimidazole phosphoribosyltransferase